MDNFFKKKEVKSFLFTTMLYLSVFLILGFQYETNDDSVVAKLIEQNYLSPFSFQWTSYVANWLGKLFPISGWGLFLFLPTYISSLKLIEILFSNIENKLLKRCSIFVIIITLTDLLFQFQFTKISSFLLIVSFLCLEEFFTTKKKNNLIFFLIFLIFGISIRYKTLFIVLPFACLFTYFKYSKNKKLLLKRIGVFVLIFLLSFICNIIDQNTLPKYQKDFLAFNEVRSNVLDFDKAKVSEDKLNLLQPELSKNDFNIIDNYLYIDNEYFTSEKLLEIHEIINNRIKLSFTEIFNNIIKNLFLLLFHPLVLLLIYLLVLVKDKKNILYLLGMFSLAIIFTLLSRFPVRLIYSIAITGILFFLYQNKNLEISHNKILKLIIIPIIFISIFTQYSLPVFITKTNPVSIINSYIDNHSKDAFLYGYSILKIEQSSENFLSNKTDMPYPNRIFSGWTMGHPIFYDKLSDLKINNPIQDLVNKNNYYFVSYGNTSECEYIKIYLKEHFNINAECKIKERINNFYINKLERSN